MTMCKTIDTPLTRASLAAMLAGIDRAEICLVGDLCLDMYWHADLRLSELSRETPHYPLPIVSERYAPGGAGNVACNIAALQPKRLSVIGVMGTDWRGDLLEKSLVQQGVDASQILRRAELVTNTYIKPIRHGISSVAYEDPRLDFENRSPLSDDCESAMLEALSKNAEHADILCVSDQMAFGCITPAVRAWLGDFASQGGTVVVDSRNHAAEYRNAIVKPNEIEASRAFGDGAALDLDSLARLASHISQRNRKPAIITLGERGCFVADGDGAVRCPAAAVEPPIDFCGAGDTFLAGFACLLASGASPIQAAQGANLCASVTIKKIGATGTATREEVLAALK